jgi:hypothetical protein
MDGGMFVFDMHTRRGLNAMQVLSVLDGEDHLVVTRALPHPDRPELVARISGCIRTDGDRWERFEHRAVQTAFSVADTIEALHAAGWRQAYAAVVSDLSRPVAEPEALGRIHFVAIK